MAATGDPYVFIIGALAVGGVDKPWRCGMSDNQLGVHSETGLLRR